MVGNSTVETMLDRVVSALPAGAVDAISAWRHDPQILARLDDLSERATEGLLDPEERAEYETFINFADLLAALQIRARHRALASRP